MLPGEVDVDTIRIQDRARRQVSTIVLVRFVGDVALLQEFRDLQYGASGRMGVDAAVQKILPQVPS